MWVDVALPLPVESLFTYKVPEKLVDHVQVGHLVSVPFRNHSISGIVVHIRKNEPLTAKPTFKEIQFILNPAQTIPTPLLELTKWISEKYGCSWGESLLLASPFLRKSKKLFYRDNDKNDLASAINDFALKDEGALLPAEYEVGAIPTSLTDEQLTALSPIEEAVQKEEFKAFLLFGVTSSGKTEVYLRTIQKIFQKGKQALFLVPEISLCAPFYQILTRRFPEHKIGVWHSQITAREKMIFSEQIRNGTINIVLGARSALFAPFHNLGVIILDEEHDTSYKQHEKPRYHAREVALKLAELYRAVIVLGSATPSIESFYRAEKGELTKLKMYKRIPSHSLPHMTIVDRKTKTKGFSPFNPKLVEAISIALARREQVILALNRRGYSTFLICNSCGYVWKCASCQVTLVHHQETDTDQTSDVLRCHYCFRENPLPTHCEKCQSPTLLLGGIGTQKVVQELKKQFPSARILRLDRDVARKKSASSKTYKKFREESADILVGTQMVTQGFDFPRVTLVGILDADTALYHPDFRSSEKTFQWISHAAGRAGRSSLGGKVIIQSTVPDHYVLKFACRHDYESFYKKEIESRKALHYPPFSSLILFRIQSSKRKDWVISESERLYQTLKETADVIHKQSGGKNEADETVQLLGPGPSPKEHLRKQLRWQILVKCKTQESMQKFIDAGKSFVPKSGVRIIIDVDPYDLL